MDTIFAPATARGKAGLSVIRISGPDAHAALSRMIGPLPPLRKAAVRDIVWQGDTLDEAIVLAFSAGASFTGEDVAELHLHGSVAVTQAVLRALEREPGLRLAKPGEFTRRALENGRLDLTQVEGLADLIDAETEAQRRQALRVLSGELGEQVAGWRRDLIRVAALLEASIDFVDEDVPVDVRPEVVLLVDALLHSLRHAARGSVAAERIRDGFEVAIIGAPNVGKSTLLNALAGRKAAITSHVAGTTRDVIEVRMDLGGLPVTLLDTAGLRQTDDPVEQLGIALAIERSAAADLRVLLIEDGEPIPDVTLNAEDIVLLAKSDTISASKAGVSGKTGAGVGELLARITDVLASRVAAPGALTRQRHRKAVAEAILVLEAARSELLVGLGRSELVANDVRRAIQSLDSLVGRIDVEVLLGEIFASFCIGK